MHKIALVIFLALSSNVFAAKSYALKVKVYSLTNHLPLEGFTVFTQKNDQKIEVGHTNAEGEIVIEELREKYINIVVEDPENFHRQGVVYVYNTKRNDLEEELFLRLNQVHEEKYFSSVDAKYENDSSAMVHQVPNGKSSISEKDSIDFIPGSPLGGVPEFFKFLHLNIEYPHDCYTNNIQGKVYLSFIVQKDGTITHVNVVKGVHKSLDDEAIRIIRYAPKWNPAMSDGQPIKSMVKTPISFTLN